MSGPPAKWDSDEEDTDWVLLAPTIAASAAHNDGQHGNKQQRKHAGPTPGCDSGCGGGGAGGAACSSSDGEAAAKHAVDAAGEGGDVVAAADEAGGAVAAAADGREGGEHDAEPVPVAVAAAARAAAAAAAVSGVNSSIAVGFALAFDVNLPAPFD
eukprot:PLAT15569.1.p3 GENE.PLAT15569.1~~PLAT15569.1.p3  ORF type:complete len:156 (-),score=45.90 PLAT15569.1:455-922(-)